MLLSTAEINKENGEQTVQNLQQLPQNNHLALKCQKQSDSTCHTQQDMRGLWLILKRTGWCCKSPDTQTPNQTSLGKWKILHIQRCQAWASLKWVILMLLKCVAFHTEGCYTISIMGKGPKGGIWYAGEGEQDQNYLTQLVLRTRGERR